MTLSFFSHSHCYFAEDVDHLQPTLNSLNLQVIYGGCPLNL